MDSVTGRDADWRQGLGTQVGFSRGSLVMLGISTGILPGQLAQCQQETPATVLTVAQCELCPYNLGAQTGPG